MRETRRKFLTTAAMLASALAAGSGLLAVQEKHRGMPSPPQSAEPQDEDKNQSKAPDPQALKNALLARNQKEFREDVEQLYQLTRELREEVEKTTTTDVFSVRMYKKAEQIEKLAKRLKGKVQGG
jgi:hypothetical protein